MPDDNKIVHGLWIGEYLSPLELLCIQSFTDAGHEFYLWTYQTISNLPDSVVLKDANTILPHREVFSYAYSNKFGHGKGSYAGFSDIFRYKLLYEFGGWWTDMDITCLKPLTYTELYVFRANGTKGIVGNLMKCPARSELMFYCYTRAKKEMNKLNTQWLLPVTILNDGIKKFDLETYKKTFTNEDSWPVVSSYLIKKQKLDNSWSAFHWMNEEWRRFNINKDSYIIDSALENLLTRFQIEHSVLNKNDSALLKQKLSKWNYRFLNVAARIKWIYRMSVSSFSNPRSKSINSADL